MIGHRYKLPFLSNRWQHRRAARKMVQLVWEIKLLQEPLSRFSLLEIILSDFIDSYKCACSRFRMHEIIFLLINTAAFPTVEDVESGPILSVNLDAIMDQNTAIKKNQMSRPIG